MIFQFKYQSGYVKYGAASASSLDCEIRGGLGSQTGRGKNIKAAPLTMAAQRAVSGACNGWGPGARLKAPVGVQEEKAPGKIWGFMQF